MYTMYCFDCKKYFTGSLHNTEREEHHGFGLCLCPHCNSRNVAIALPVQPKTVKCTVATKPMRDKKIKPA